MKSIRVLVDDDLYDKIKFDSSLIIFSKDCVSVSTLERCMVNIVKSIEDNKEEVLLSFTKE